MPLDPNLLNVLLGVVANGLAALIAGSYNRLKGLTESQAETAIKENLTAQIREAVEEVSDTIEWTEPPQVEEVCLFITSPEVEAVVRQLYATSLFAEQRKTLDDIQEEFQKLFAYRFGPHYNELENKADSIFRALAGAIERALNVATSHGVLSAHEAKSSIRFRILRDELLTLRKNIEFLTTRQIDVDAINRFVERYREQIADRHGRITPPNFDDARKLPIDSIYVVPNFEPSNILSGMHKVRIGEMLFQTYLDVGAGSAKFLTDENLTLEVHEKQLNPAVLIREQIQASLAPSRKDFENWMLHYYKEGYVKHTLLIGLPDLLSKIYRTVILGNPGGGKSTLTNKICYDFTKRSSGELARITPIPVILREYGNEKRNHNYSILEFIEATARDKYQVAPPSGAIEYLLLNGRAAVIFDGLDELLETGYRQEIRDDIESFCNRYPSVPVVVTSREVGYEQAPLSSEKFEAYRLAPFNEEQVSEYVEKWFNTRIEYTSIQKQQKSRGFLQESQIVSDLRSNPLMLGLMCNIYRGENYIPKNRPDVYRKCAEMLFERWDRSREIPVTFHFEDDIRPAMAYLAHWIYSDVKLQEGVTERSLIDKAAGYLLEHRFENRDRAERAAREFIEFCRGRAWVFTEAGTDKEGEGLYQFTHRTFLEYFTAVYLVRTHETTEELIQILLPRIRKREWDIVAQLAFQIKNRSSEGAKDKLLSALLGRELETGQEEAWNLISFAARCLEFMEPSPRVTREIATTFIKKCLSLSTSNRGSKRKTKHGATISLPEEVLRALISAGEQNIETIASSLKDVIVDFVKNGSQQEATLALEIGLHLDWPVNINVEREERSYVLSQFWNRVSRNIVAEVKERVRELASNDFSLSRDAYRLGLYSLEEIINHFDMAGIFRQTRLKLFNEISFEPIAVTLFRELVKAIYSDSKDSSSDSNLSNIRRIGHLTLKAKTSLPFININPKSAIIPSGQLISDKTNPKLEDGNISSFDSDLIFGTFVLLAVWLEGLYHKIIKLNVLGKKGKKRGKYPEKTLEFRATQLLGQYLRAGKPLIGREDLYAQLLGSRVTIFIMLRTVLFSRYSSINGAEINNALTVFSLSAEQEDFVRRWMKREISLVNPIS